MYKQMICHTIFSSSCSSSRIQVVYEMKSSGDLNFHDMVEKYCLLQNWGRRRMLPKDILAMLLIIFPAGTFMEKIHKEK